MCRHLLRVGGGIICRGHFDHITADQIDPLQARKNANISRGVRPPISGVPVPGAKAGSILSISNEI